MDWIQQWQSKLNKQNGVAPLVRTGGSRHTGLAAPPHRNIHMDEKAVRKLIKKGAKSKSDEIIEAIKGYTIDTDQVKKLELLLP